MPSILCRSHIQPAGQSHNCMRYEQSLSMPMLGSSSSVFEERTRNTYHRSNSGRPLSRPSSRTLLMFQILSDADVGMHNHDRTSMQTSRSPSFSTMTSRDDSSCGQDEAKRMEMDIKNNTQKRRSTMSHVQAEHRNSIQTHVKRTMIHPHSVSSPSLPVVEEATSITTSLPTLSDEDLSWGHYIDVTTVTDDLDRRIDLYRQRRNEKINKR